MNNPYEGCKIYGPYKRKDGRKHIVIYNRALFIRRTMSYSRYRLEIKLGRKLLSTEETHHIDGNVENDNDNNLEPIRFDDHRRKHIKEHFHKRFYK